MTSCCYRRVGQTLVLVSWSLRMNLADNGVRKAIEFIERKYKTLKSERGPDWVAAEEFCP